MSGTPEHGAAGAGDGNRLSPAQLLDEMRASGDRTGAAARGYWLPLFGALICGSLAFYERLPAPLPGLGRPAAASSSPAWSWASWCSSGRSWPASPDR